VFLRLVAATGAIVTTFACARMIIGMRRGETRDQILGWFAIMVAAPAIVFALDRVL
jgi:hypothetical protein